MADLKFKKSLNLAPIKKLSKKSFHFKLTTKEKVQKQREEERNRKGESEVDRLIVFLVVKEV